MNLRITSPTLKRVFAILLSVAMVVGLATAISPKAQAAGTMTASVSGSSAAVPTNSSISFTVTLNCTNDTGCAGSRLYLPRPTNTSNPSYKLYSQLALSLVSGVTNPAIAFKLVDANTDNPYIEFTRFDKNVSQQFSASWLTKDPFVIPGTYATNWRLEYPTGTAVSSGTATGQVSGTPEVSLRKDVVTGIPATTYAGEIRTFRLKWYRFINKSGSTGVTTTLVDKLPSNYKFLGFNETGIAFNTLYRAATTMPITTTNGSMSVTTPDGVTHKVYEYDPVAHAIYIYITPEVDKYMGAVNNNEANVNYQVQVEETSSRDGNKLLDGQVVENTLSAIDPKRLDGTPVTLAPSIQRQTYRTTRPYNYAKLTVGSRTVSNTTDQDTNPDMQLNWVVRATNPSSAPVSLTMKDTMFWKTAMPTDYHYFTRIALDPVLYNDGYQSYGGTVTGYRADGTTVKYTILPNQPLDIPLSDKIVAYDLTVDNFRQIDAMPSSDQNGILNVNVTTNVRAKSSEIAVNGANSNELFNRVGFFVNGVNTGKVAQNSYVINAFLPWPRASLAANGAVTELQQGSNFYVTAGIYAHHLGNISNPEAFMVLPKGMTLGSNPAFTEAYPGQVCQAKAEDFQFERLADYNGSERWRITLKDPNQRLDPKTSPLINCYKLQINVATAEGGFYDQEPLNVDKHKLQLWVREMGGVPQHASSIYKDPYDVNSDGNLGGQWDYASLTTSVAKNSAISVNKTALGDLSGQTPVSGLTDSTRALNTVNYTITATSDGTMPVSKMAVYDFLPTTQQSSSSSWVELGSRVEPVKPYSTFGPVLSGPVTPIDSTARVAVYYTTATNPCRPELGAGGCTGFNDRNEWTTTFDPAQAANYTAVRIEFLDSVRGTFNFNMPMTIPDSNFTGQTLTDKDVAINRVASGATSYSGAALPYVGTAYAQAIPQSQIGINKSVIVRDVTTDGLTDADAPLVRRGDELIWKVSATAYHEGAAAADPMIVDKLPASLEFIETLNTAAYPSAGTYDAATGQWKPGLIQPSETKYLYVKVRATGSGMVTNKAYYFDPATGGAEPTCQPIQGDNGVQPCDTSAVLIDAGSSSISGNVFQDLDWSNTQTAGDGAVGNLNVYLGEVRADGSVVFVAQTVTDAAGNYTFSNLPQGNYRVGFAKQDGVRYAAANQGGNDAIDSDATGLVNVPSIADPDVIATGMFSVGLNQQVIDVDLGVQPLANLTGTVFDDLEGNGMRDAGDPALAGATVLLLDSTGQPARIGYSATNASGTVATQITVGADGTYSFTGIRPGNYQIRVTAPGGYTYTQLLATNTDMTTAGFNDVGSSGTSATFPLAVGDNSNIDAGLQKLATIGGVVWTDNDGSGTHNEDTPRAGVQVQLLDATGTPIPGRVTTTNAAGQYTFPNLVPGQYSVQVINPDPSKLSFTATAPTNNFAEEDGSNVNVSGQSAVITVAPGASLMRIDAGLLPLSTISGSIFYDDNHNGTWDASEPLKQRPLTIQLHNVADGSIVAETTTVDGAYSFPGVAPGKYYVEMINPWRGTYTTQSTATDLTATRDSNVDHTGVSPQFDVVGGATYANIDAGANRNQEVSGFAFSDANGNGIWDDGETPLAGVTATLTDSMGATQTATTDANGYYYFSSVVVGATTVTFTQPEGSVVSPRTGDPANITVPKLSDIDPGMGSVVFGVTGYTDPANWAAANVTNVDAGFLVPVTVSGIAFRDRNYDGLYEAATDGLLPGITVNLLDATGAVVATTTSQADGSYTFPDVRPGSYQVEFVAPDGAKFGATADPAQLLDPGFNDAGADGRTATFTVASGTPVANVDGGIIDSTVISGIIWTGANDNGLHDPDEPGRAGVPVYLHRVEGGVDTVVATTYTIGDGSYAFTDVAPGSYYVEVAKTGGVVMSSQYTGQNQPLDAPTFNDGYEDPATTLWRTAEFTTLSGTNIPNVDIGLTSLAGVSGGTYQDLNRDGAHGADEPPLAGVVVHVVDYLGEDANGDPIYGNSFDTVSDEFGFYFAEVPSGHQYVVRFEQPADTAIVMSTDPTRVPNEPGFSDPVSSGLNGDILYGETLQFAVNPSEHYSNVTAGFAVNAAVSGKVMEDLNNNGTFEDPDRAYADPVTVELWSVNADGTPNTLVTTTTTAADGTYRFDQVTTFGQFKVRFVLPDGSPMVFVPGPRGEFYFVEGENISDVAADGWTEEFNITIGTETATIDAGVVRTSTITGVAFEDVTRDGLRGEGNSVLAGVTVALLDASGTVIAETTTLADGTYAFTNLLPGDYQLRFDTPAGAVITTQDKDGNAYDTIDSDIAPATGTTGTVTITAPLDAQSSVVSNIDAGYLLDADISGRAWLDLNNNGIFDAGEQPYSNMDVVIMLETASDNAPLEYATTDVDGRYSFNRIAPGNYVIAFLTPDGYVYAPKAGGDPITEENKSDVDPATGLTDAFTLQAGTNVINVDGGLVPITTVTGYAFEDANFDGSYVGDLPRAGVDVQLISSDGTVVATATTNEGGFYQFEGVVPGDYTVKFPLTAPEKFSPLGSDSKVAADGTVAITVTPQTPVNEVNAGYLTSGIISGFSFKDYNGDGDYGDATNPVPDPLEGTVVELVDVVGDSLPTPYVLTVGPDGTFTFAGVAPGAYRLKFTAPQTEPLTTYPPRTTAITEQYLNDAKRIDTTVGLTDVIRIEAGQVVPHIDVGFRPGSTISGVAFNDRDFDYTKVGDPGIAGVEVQLINAQGTLVATTTTDIGGVYSFNDVLEGVYSVRFVTPAGTAAFSGGDSVVDAAGVKTGIVVGTSIDTVNVTNIDAGYRTAAELSGIAFTDTNNNGVQDPDEAVLPGLLVQVLDASGNVVPEIAPQRTAADGSYGFVLPAGQYQVQFVPEVDGGVTFSTTLGSEIDLAATNDVDALGKSALITVAAGTQVNNLDAGIISFAAISGSAFESPNGSGVQAEGTALEGILVTLYRMVDGQQVKVSEVLTDAVGNYAFTGVVPDDYVVTFAEREGQGFVDKRADSVVDALGTATITLQPGQSAANIDAGYYADELASVSGRVWVDNNADGQEDGPQSGVTVMLYDGDGNPVLAADGTPVTAVTGANGEYTFPGLPAGDYQVAFQLPEGAAFVEGQPASASFTLAVNEVKTGVDTGVQFSHLSGEVFFDTDGDGRRDATEPLVPTAELTLTNSDGVSVPVTVVDGKYQVDGLPAGDYILTTVVDGVSYSSTVTIPAGSSVIHDVPVPPAPPVVGDVSGSVFSDLQADGNRDTGDTGLSGLTVVLLDDAGNIIYNTLTDADGNYTFTGVPVGGYTLKVFGPNGQELTSVKGDTGNRSDTQQITVTEAGLSGWNFGFTPIVVPTPTVTVTVTPTPTSTPPAEPSPSDSPSATPTEPARVTVTVTETSMITAEPTPQDTPTEPAPVTSEPTPTLTVEPTLTLTAEPTPTLTATAEPTPTVVPEPTSSQPAPEPTVEPTPVAQPGAISGRIFADANRDGMIDAEDQGIAGVTVTLIGADGSLFSAVTGADGVYTFTGLPAGEYRIQVDSGTSHDGKELTSAYTYGTVDPQPFATVTVGEGAATNDVNFGYSDPLPVIVPVPGSITGIIFIDGGTLGVLEPSESRIGGVEIVLLDATGAEIARTVTDLEGKFAFGDITPGTYTVLVRTGEAPIEGVYELVSDPSGATGSNAEAQYELTVTENALGISDIVEDIDFGFEMLPVVEPTPVVTPTVTEEPSVEPTPVVTPSVTEQPSVEPTPVVTPSVTEQPSVEPTPVVTPSVTVTVTDEPVPSSAPEPSPSPCPDCEGSYESGGSWLLGLLGLGLLSSDKGSSQPTAPVATTPVGTATVPVTPPASQPEVQSAQNDRGDKPSDSALARTGADVVGVLTIAGLVLLAGVFLIKRKR